MPRHHLQPGQSSARPGGAGRKANPRYELNKLLVYVGMTGLDPDLRFDRHKAGVQAIRFVQAYGLRLGPHLFEIQDPMHL